jgi:AmmeMemoRadiSam system protein B
MIVRSAVYAGLQYPADPGRLQAAVLSWMEDAPQPRQAGDLIGLVVPRGGHAEIGALAGHGYKMLMTAPLRFDRVTLLAPAPPDARTLLAEPADMFEMPVEDLPVDTAALSALEARGLVFTRAADEDFAIETHLPFVHAALGALPVLALRVPAGGAPALADHADTLGFVIAIANLRDRDSDTRLLGTLNLPTTSATRGLGRLFAREAVGTPDIDRATLLTAQAVWRAQGASRLHVLKHEGQRLSAAVTDR